MGFDGARLGELELGSDEPVTELAGLDRELLHVARDLVAVADEDGLERADAAVVLGCSHEHDQVRREVGGELGNGLREERPGDVDARRRAGNLTEVQVLDEEGRNDVHRCRG